MYKPMFALLGLAIVGLLFAACGGTETVVVTREVPVEVTKEVPVEVTREVPVEVTKEVPVEVTKEVPVEVTKEVPVEVTKEVPVEVTKQVTVIVTPTPQPTATPQADPRYCCVLTMQQGGGGDSNFNNWECAASNTCLVQIGPMYNTLVEFSPDTPDTVDIGPDLASSWSLGSDGTTLTFNIHPDAAWWDGTPVTAADVVWSLDQMTRTDGVPRPLTSVIVPFYAGSSEVDSKTVEVRTNFPAPMFPNYLASEHFKIMPKHHFESMSEEDMRMADNQLGSGPYKLGDWDPDVSFEYSKNQDYWKEGRPYFDMLKYFVIIDAGSVTAAFKTGQVLTQNHPTNGLSAKANGKLGRDQVGKGFIFFAGPVAVLWVTMNTARDPFSDVRVRRAFQIAAHPQAVTDTFSGGIDDVGSPFPPDTWFGISQEELFQIPGFRESAPLVKHPDDLALANQLLADAGFPEGEGIDIQDFNSLIFAEFVDMAQLLAAQLRTAFPKIKIRVNAIPFTTEIALRGEGKYDMTQAGHAQAIVDPDDFISLAYETGGNDIWGPWGHPRIDELAPLQRQEVDRPTRLAMVREIADILLTEDSPHIFETWRMNGMYVDARIQNFNPPAGITDAFKFEHLWCSPAC